MENMENMDIENLKELIDLKDIPKIKDIISKKPSLIIDLSKGYVSILRLLYHKFDNEDDILKYALNLIKKEYLSAFIELKDIYGETFLFDSIREGKFNTTKILIEYGANPNIKNKFGESLLHICAWKESTTEILKFLLELIPNLKEDKDLNGRSPLEVAALKGNYSNVKILLEYGCKIDFDIETILNDSVRTYLENFQDLPPY